MNNQDMAGLTCFSMKIDMASSPLSKSLNCLVLESDPKPGYYSKNNFPENKHVHDWHLFLPVKKQIACFQDIILRNVPLLTKQFNIRLRIAPGQVVVKNKSHACIRVNVENKDILPKLVTEFKKLGIKFLPSKTIESYNSLIYFKKYIEFEELDKGIYQDKENPNQFFFKIPKPIEFDTFLAGMESIKFSCNFHLFDSSLVSLFVKDDVWDFVGIYSEHCDKNRFKELQHHLEQTFSA